MLLDIIAGARPNFRKIAPIIRALQAREAQGGALRYRLVYTGQWKHGGIPPLWDGRTGERIVAALERLLAGA